MRFSVLAIVADTLDISSPQLQRGEAEQHKHDGDNPEADDHPRLGPPFQLKVVMDGSHAKHTFPG